jgi:hypothetical protein
VTKKFGAFVSMLLAGALAFAPASAASAIDVGEVVTFSGNTITWTNGWVDHSLDQNNGNLLFVCPLNVPDADCQFGQSLLAMTARQGDTSITLCGTFGGALVLGTTYKARIVKFTGGVSAQVAVGQIVPNLPCPGGPAPSPAPASSAPEVERFGAPAMGVALQGTVGGLVEGTPVSFTGTSMKTGANYILTVNSNPVILAEGVIAEGGRISGLPRLPALPPGTHTLRLTTTGWDGSTLVISQVFVVGGDGRFTAINDPVGSVNPAEEEDRLAYTGVSSTSLPWWALSMLSLGILLVLYSARAQQMALRPELLQALRDARDPWEVLSTPIRVPGIDYVPSRAGSSDQAPSLGEAMRELDLAFSKMIVDQLAKMGMSAKKA